MIGQLRDADVLAQDVPSTDQPDLTAQTDKLRRRVRKVLLHDRADHLAEEVEQRFSGKKWRGTSAKAKALRAAPVTGLAAKALDHSWHECLSHGPALAAMAPAKRHDLRKSLKTFRYLSADFSGLWPGDLAQPYLTILPALQDDLGRLNDLAMARSHGLAVADTDEAETLQRAAAAWAQLALCAKWWG